MKRRIKTTTERLIAGMPDPDDYFRGLRRPADALPDNVLLFTRRDARWLRPTSVTSAFHQRWVLIVALAGRGTVVLDRKPYSLRAGEVLLVPPLHLHAYDNLDGRLTWLFTTFEWPGHTAMGEAWRSARRLDATARTRLDALIKEWRARQPDGLLAAAHLLTLLRRLFPRTEKPRQSEPAAQGGLIAAVRAAAEAEPTGKLRALARRVGLSESHLRARFRSEAGISLGRYLRESRLRQAAIWLREENISVKTAAERAGYPDIYAFSRAFRRSLGVPPSQVRIPK